MNTIELHKNIYDKLPRFISQAPGRVNIIGEHTDYNGGYALPVAIDRYIQVALSPRKDPLIRVYSGNFQKYGEFTTRELERTKNDELWLRYVKGTLWVLEDIGIPLYGADLTILGNVPTGAGLSSSAALTVSLLLLFLTYAEVKYEKKLIPIYAQRVENEYIGVNCGLMDQTISLFGKKDNALFIDFKDLGFSYVPFKLKDTALLVFDTKAKRTLASSAYNKRRSECEEGLAILNRCLNKDYRYLGEVEKEEFFSCRDSLPPLIRNRVKHVIGENERVIKVVDLLKRGDIGGVGELLFKTHESLAHLYEVSSFELDTAVDLAREFGVIGARMTGAGFGGCTINLLDREKVDEFKSYIVPRYREKTGLTPSVYEVEVSDGAHIL